MRIDYQLDHSEISEKINDFLLKNKQSPQDRISQAQANASHYDGEKTLEMRILNL